MPVDATPQIVAELAPHGVLRAAINMSNFLLVTGRTAAGDPTGVSPSMAAAIADRLGVPVKSIPFAKPGELADLAGKDVWDIGNIGAEPARAEKIAFTAAYVEIEATYLVPAGSPLKTIADVDKPGVRIAVAAPRRRLQAAPRRRCLQTPAFFSTRGIGAALRRARNASPRSHPSRIWNQET